MSWCVVLAVGLAVVSSVGAAAQTPVTSADILARDQLIANQENLLNIYRCLFAADVDVVPGGCPDPDVVVPGAAPESPTQMDLAVRDQLIADQEALLNVYRCAHSVDTQLVPGGCGTQARPTSPDSVFTAISVGGGHACALTVDSRAVCWGYSWGQLDAPDGQFTAISSGGSHTCALDTNGRAVCWGYNSSGQLDVPDGTYTAITASSDYTCALRTDKTIACWAWTTNLPAGVSWAN